jgi:hypothetical protein
MDRLFDTPARAALALTGAILLGRLAEEQE